MTEEGTDVMGHLDAIVEEAALGLHSTSVAVLGSSSTAWIARCACCEWKFVAGDRILVLGHAKVHETRSVLLAALAVVPSTACPTCEGTGNATLWAPGPDGLGDLSNLPRPCQPCDGSGRVEDPEAPRLALVKRVGWQVTVRAQRTANEVALLSDRQAPVMPGFDVVAACPVFVALPVPETEAKK